MKLITISISIVLLLIIQTDTSYGQQADSTRRKSIRYMSRYLQTDSVTAAKVTAIQEAYRTALDALIADSTVNLQQRRNAAEKLMDDKNAKLEPLLPVSALEKIIPSTERKRKLRGSDSTAVNQ